MEEIGEDNPFVRMLIQQSEAGVVEIIPNLCDLAGCKLKLYLIFVNKLKILFNCFLKKYSFVLNISSP